ncbi:MAG: ribonuclease J [Clostridia bacterium]|nr:ribonuclease J [Clostridia bacterium]
MNNDTNETKKRVSDNKEKRTKTQGTKRTYSRKTNYTNKKKAESSNRSAKRTKKEKNTKAIKKKNVPIIDFEFKKSNLKIIALGGLDEIGKNITVFEYEDEIILVDCGLEFPDDDMLGVDLVIPDFTYLVKNQGKVKGLFITHGHEDHIGSIPYLLRQINIPIYATRLAAKLISHKLEEHRLLNTTQLNVVEAGDVIETGKMQVEFIRSSHSIPDSCMLAIHTPIGRIVHTGDFKVDYTPIDGQRIDFGRLAELGNEGVLALLADSTNAERKGFTMSEKSIGPVFDKLFEGCKKRIVVATFASNVHRVQQIVNSAVKYGRKIAVSGRSMINMIDAARELNYIDAPDNLFIDIDLIKNYTDEQLVIITTGSQGETMSALTRMANGEHRKVTITGNDLVIISANPIPGNEKSVSKVINQLMKIGAEVVYSALEDIHVSGHACQEEQKLIMALTKPKFFLPVHGEYRQLTAHRDTAIEMGIQKENIFITMNGKVLEMNADKAEFTGAVISGRVMVDGLGVGDVGSIVLRDRQHLSQDGLIAIVITMNAQTGEIVSGPDVISRGFVYVRESENLMEEVKGYIREEIYEIEQNHITDWGAIKSTLKDDVRDFVFKRTKRNPMILPIIMEV